MTTGLLNPTHIAIVLVIALIVFGPKRLPELARSAGNSLRELKDSVSGEHREEHTAVPEASGHETVATPHPESAIRG